MTINWSLPWISVKDAYPDFEEEIIFTDGCCFCGGQYNCRDEDRYWSLGGMNIVHYVSQRDSEISYETAGFISTWAPWGPIGTEAVSHWMRITDI